MTVYQQMLLIVFRFILFISIGISGIAFRFKKKKYFFYTLFASFALLVGSAFGIAKLAETIVSVYYDNSLLMGLVNFFIQLVVLLLILISFLFLFNERFAFLLMALTLAFSFVSITVAIPTPFEDNLLVYNIIAILIPLAIMSAVYISGYKIFDYIYSVADDIPTSYGITFFLASLINNSLLGSLAFNLRNESEGVYVIYKISSALVAFFLILLEVFICLNHKKTKEAALEKILRENQRKQFEDAKDKVEEINIRFHDLKHQLNNMKGNSNYVKNLSDLINKYNAKANTGNPTLDVILSEKMYQCVKNNIQFTSLIDGKLLAKMNDVDLYSLFGNILDNAIEYLKTVPEDKRVLKLYLKKKLDFVYLCARNYCLQKPIINNNRIETTKEDKAHHGLGLKSIDKISQKYGGTMEINVKDQIFELSILFPENLKKTTNGD